MSQCPDDQGRILMKMYEDETVLIEKVLGEIVEIEEVVAEV